jgi:hypothetical protein
MMDCDHLLFHQSSGYNLSPNSGEEGDPHQNNNSNNTNDGSGSGGVTGGPTGLSANNNNNNSKLPYSRFTVNSILDFETGQQHQNHPQHSPEERDHPHHHHHHEEMHQHSHLILSSNNADGRMSTSTIQDCDDGNNEILNKKLLA